MPDVLNIFFSKITSNSKANQAECLRFIDKTFLNLKQNNKVNTPGFSFSIIDKIDVEKVIKDISISSSPGVTGIPTRILKDLITNLSSVLSEIFNNCELTGIIDEWKLQLFLHYIKTKD